MQTFTSLHLLAPFPCGSSCDNKPTSAVVFVDLPLALPPDTHGACDALGNQQQRVAHAVTVDSILSLFTALVDSRFLLVLLGTPVQQQQQCTGKATTYV